MIKAWQRAGSEVVMRVGQQGGGGGGGWEAGGWWGGQVGGVLGSEAGGQCRSQPQLAAPFVSSGPNLPPHPAGASVGNPGRRGPSTTWGSHFPHTWQACLWGIRAAGPPPPPGRRLRSRRCPAGVGSKVG